MEDTGRVVYEVGLDIDADIADAFRAWLDGHMAQIMTLPGFVAARLSRVDDPAAAHGRVSLCAQYTLSDAAALEAYLRDHAPRMRAEGLARFGGSFNAQRRVTTTLATYAAD